MKESVKNSKSQNLRDIFDRTTVDDPNGTEVGYGEVENLMYRTMRKDCGKIPKNLDGLNSFLNDRSKIIYHSGEESLFYRGTFCNQKSAFSIFCSNNQIELLENAKTVSMDGTFKIVPNTPLWDGKRRYYQMFIICAKVHDHFFPVVYALMSNKTKILYEQVFDRIKTFVRDFSPETILSDYESGIIFIKIYK